MLDPRRAQNVGASEVPALFSAAWVDEAAAPDELDPFETRFALWMRKAGKLPAEPESVPSFTGARPALRDRLFWGNVREQGIAQAIADVTGWKIQPGGFVQHPSLEGMSATPDFFLTMGATDGVLEIKNVDRIIFRRWPERIEPGVFWWRDGGWEEAEIQPPFRVKLQCQAQMAATGLPTSVTGPLVGGNELYLFRVDRHPGVIARIEREIQAFWASIAAGEPPPPDWKLDVETICALMGNVDPGTVKDLRGNEEALELARAYHDTQKREKAAKTEKDGLKAQILTLIGTAERAIFDEGFNLWAGEVAGGHRSFDVDPYRGFLLTQSKKRR
jgi:predicted phage-related endonuclease